MRRRDRHRQLGVGRDDRSRGMRSSRRQPGSAEPGGRNWPGSSKHRLLPRKSRASNRLLTRRRARRDGRSRNWRKARLSWDRPARRAFVSARVSGLIATLEENAVSATGLSLRVSPRCLLVSPLSAILYVTRHAARPLAYITTATFLRNKNRVLESDRTTTVFGACDSCASRCAPAKSLRSQRTRYASADSDWRPRLARPTRGGGSTLVAR
jgi:hypothetical protein